MEKIKTTLVFLLGFISCLTLLYFYTFFSNFNLMTGFIITIDNAPQSSKERIPRNDIILKQNEIILKIPNATISHYSNTNSMLPTLGENSKGIRIKPSNETDIDIGNIISFKKNNNLIVHRVIEIGKDNLGTYFITKGDNNNFKDGKIRFHEIEYVTIGIIW
jgi:signal peptidase I